MRATSTLTGAPTRSSAPPPPTTTAAPTPARSTRCSRPPAADAVLRHSRGSSLVRLPWPAHRPPPPSRHLDPCAVAPAIAVRVRRCGVVARDAVDVGQVGVLLDRDDLPAQADLVIPVVLAEHGKRDARVAAYELQPLAPL